MPSVPSSAFNAPSQLFSLAIAAIAISLALYRHPHEVHGPRRDVLPASRIHGTAWAPDAPGNSVLNGEFISRGKIHFAETAFVRATPSCDVYATDNRGRVWSLPETADAAPRLIAHVGGALLGAAFDSQGGMYLAESTRGLLYVPHDAPHATRIVATLAPSGLAGAHEEADLDSTEIRYCNDIAVDRASGLVYFTDSSSIAPSVATNRRADTFRSYSSSHITGDATGRLLVYNPNSGATHVLVTGIPFANGVGVSKDGAHVIFASSSAYTVRKVQTVSANVSALPTTVRFEDTARFYNASLPGMPDGLTVDQSDGSVFVPIFGPVPPIVRFLDIAPRWVRRVMVSLPPQWRPKPSSVYTMIAQFDAGGTLLRVRHDTKRLYGLLTSVDRCGKYLYCGALKGHFVARFDLSK